MNAYLKSIIKTSLLVLLAFSLVACKDSVSKKTQEVKLDLQNAIDAAALSPSKTLELDKGVYTLLEPIKFTKKHSALTIRSKSGNPDDVIITAGKAITGWKKNPDGTYQAKVPNEREVGFLLMGGKRVEAAKTDYIYIIPDFINKSGNSFSVRNCDIKELLKLPKDAHDNVWLDIYVGWSFFRVAIDRLEIGSDTTRVIFKGPKLTMRFGYYPRVIFHNIPALLNKSPAYVFDSHTGIVRCIPPAGVNPTKDKVLYPFINTIVTTEATPDEPIENLSIEGISFNMGSRRKNEDGSWGLHRQADPASSGFMIFDHTRNLKISNCKISNCDMFAIWLRRGVWDAKVSENEFYAINAAVRVGEVTHGAVKTPKIPNVPEERDGVSTGRVTIQNNIIYNYGIWAKSACSIVVYDSNHVTIDHNDIFHGYYSGISCGFTFGLRKTNNHHNIISFNRIRNLSFGHTSDLGGIYTLGVQPHSKMFGNYISDVYSHLYGGNGIYNDEGSSGWVISGNAVQNINGVGYSHSYGRDMILENNLIVAGGKCAFSFPDPRRGIGKCTWRNNVVVYTDPKTIMWGYGQPQGNDNTKLYKNLYWNATGNVKFNKYSPEEWQKLGYDKDSVFNEKPDIQALLNGAPLSKIDFKPLRVSEAGTFSKMRERADALYANYKLPPVANNDRYPPFDYGTGEDFSKKTTDKCILKKGAEIVKIDGKDVLKLFVKDNDKGTLRGRFKIENDCKIISNFKMKLTPDASFYLYVAQTGSEDGVWMHAEKCVLKDRAKNKVTLPANEWITIQSVFAINKEKPSKNARLVIRDSKGKILAEFLTPFKKEMKSLSRAGVTLRRGSSEVYIESFSVKKI